MVFKWIITRLASKLLCKYIQIRLVGQGPLGLLPFPKRDTSQAICDDDQAVSAALLDGWPYYKRNTAVSGIF